MLGVDYSQLECVASRGRFVVFVALQGERRNANVEVRAVGPFDTKRPPGNKEHSEKRKGGGVNETDHKDYNSSK